MKFKNIFLYNKQIFGEALTLGLDNKLNPPDKFMSDVMELLNDVIYFDFFIKFNISKKN